MYIAWRLYYKIYIYLFLFFFQPVLVTLSSKTDPLWRDYEQQCLTSSDNSSGSTVAHILPTSYVTAATSSQNDSIGNSNKNVFSNHHLRWRFGHILKFCQVLLWPSSGAGANYPSKLVMSSPEGAKSTWHDLLN